MVDDKYNKLVLAMEDINIARSFRYDDFLLIDDEYSDGSKLMFGGIVERRTGFYGDCS